MFVISDQAFRAFDPGPNATFVRWWFDRQSVLGPGDPAMLDTAFTRYADEADFAGLDPGPTTFEYVMGRIFMPQAEDALYVALLNIVTDVDLPEADRLRAILDLARAQAPA